MSGESDQECAEIESGASSAGQSIPSSAVRTSRTDVLSTALSDLSPIHETLLALRGASSLDDLAARLMRVLTDASGADRGVVVLEHEGACVIAADRTSGPGQIMVLSAVPLADSDRVPTGIVTKVMRTKERLILDETSQDSAFSSDPYLMRRRPTSIGCAPLSHLGSVIGALYLESYQPVLVFTSERLDLAVLLATQIATSIESDRMRQKLAQRTRQLAEAKTALDDEALSHAQFMTTMGHEIRTPMNAMIGLTRLLLQTNPTPEQRDFLETLRGSSNNLLMVLEEILGTSTAEQGELVSQPFDLRDFVEDAMDLYAAKASEKNLDLACWVDPTVPASLVGDAGKLRQILANLLSNAIKYTHSGEVVLQVGAAREGDDRYEVTFAVQDTGVGMSPAQVDNLFQPSSLSSSGPMSRRQGGLGTGLAISKRLCELMGGSIGVDSEPSVGSTFRFTILARSAPSETRAHLKRFQPELADKRVLVVDDSAGVRRTLALQLQSWGMHAATTASGSQALEWIRGGERFDVALLSAHTVRMGGVVLAGDISADPLGSAVPLVMLTWRGRTADSLRNRELHIAGSLFKPIRARSLHSTLIQILSGEPDATAPSDSSEIDLQLAIRLPLWILVVEDNAVNQKVVLRFLGLMGYRADVAENGYQALEALSQKPYDIVLMDVQMPELDGLEATREIRRRWTPERQPRIIALTANAMHGDREACLDAGMNDYISKPVQIEELHASLERWGSKQRGSVRPMPLPDSPSGMANPATVNPEKVAFLRRFEQSRGSHVVTGLIDLFRKDTTKRMAALRAGLDEGDFEIVQHEAHSLKGSSRSMGAERLATLCEGMEQLSKSRSVRAVESLFSAAEVELGRVLEAFDAERRRPPAR